MRPERDALEIRFPRVEGYRVELPEERLTADFNDESILELNPDLVGPSITRNSVHHRRAWYVCVFRPKSAPIPLANRHSFRLKSALVPMQIGTPV
jgi:hypothetical protein